MAKLRMLGARLAPVATRRPVQPTEAQRDAATPWRAWYKTPRWKALSKEIKTEALNTCVRCGRLEYRKGQLVTDHIQPHRGDPVLFWARSNLQCLCKSCHDSAKQAEEAGDRALYWPRGLRPSVVPLTLVCGPPLAGKTTWVRARAGADDLVLDLDVIACGLAGHPFRHDWDRDTWLRPALERRNDLLRALGSGGWPAAWLIIGAPSAKERSWWDRALRPARIEVLAVAPDICLSRLPPDREGQRAAVTRAVEGWWRRYGSTHDDH